VAKQEFDWEAHYLHHGPYEVEVDEYNGSICVRLKRDGRQQIFLYDVDIDEAIIALYEAKKQALALQGRKRRNDAKAN
jgi:hypothetical protein